jgi:hypothetical protein
MKLAGKVIAEKKRKIKKTGWGDFSKAGTKIENKKGRVEIALTLFLVKMC